MITSNLATNPLFEENDKDVEIKSSILFTLTSPEEREFKAYLERDSIPPGIDLTLPPHILKFQIEEDKVSSDVSINTIVMPIRITFDNPIDFNDHFSKPKDFKKDLTVALDSTKSSILPPPLLDSDSPFTAELSASVTLNSPGNEDKVFKPGILVYHAIHDKNLVTLEKNLRENISSGTLLFFKEPSFLLPPSEPPDECLNFEPNLVMKNVVLNEDLYQNKKTVTVKCTDKTKITRKPSKTRKHGHEERKSTKEARDAKPKAGKVKKSKPWSTWVNKDKLELVAANLSLCFCFAEAITDGQSKHTIQTLEDMLGAYVIDFGGSWDTHLPLVNVSPWKGVVRFSRKGKLALQYVGPFETLERVRPVAYCLTLAQELSNIHDTFHVSNLKKCLADATLQVLLVEIDIDDKLHFVEEPVEIVDREVKKLKRKRIPIVKFCWNSKRGAGFT
ncbi:hypothetical protein Tco_0497348 [Tanacetum coccineum]